MIRARARSGLAKAATFAAAVLLFACGSSSKAPATQVIVAITSDLVPESQLSRVQISLSERNGQNVVSMQDFVLVASKPKPGQQKLPITFSIGQGHAASFLLVVRGYGPFGPGGAEQEIVEQKAVATFQAHKSLLLPIFLGSVCVGNLCKEDSGQVCYATDVGLKKAGECGAVPAHGGADLKAIDPAHVPDLSKTPAGSGAADAGPKHDAGSAGSTGETDASSTIADAGLQPVDAGGTGGTNSASGGSGGVGGSSGSGGSPDTTCVVGTSQLGACTLAQ